MVSRRGWSWILVAVACALATPLMAPLPGMRLFTALLAATDRASHLAIVALTVAWLVFALVALFTPLLRRPVPWPERLARGAMGVIITATAFSTLSDPRREALLALLPYVELTVAFVVVQATQPSAGDASRAAAALALVVAVTVLVDAELPGRAAAMRAPGGITGNRNVAAEVMALALALALPWLDDSPRRRPIAAVVAAAVTLTRCRTAWLALGVAVIAALASRRPRPFALALGIALGVGVAVVVPTRLRWREAHPYADSAAHLVSVQEGSGALRLAQYRLVASQPRDAMRGWGPGAWHRIAGAADAELGRNYVPHSDYLRLFCDGGLPALLGLLCLYASLLRRGQPTALPFAVALAVTSVADVPLLRLEGMLLLALAARRPDSASS